MGGRFHGFAVDMGIDLGSIQVLMPQHFLKGAHIHAILEHQSGSSMPEFVGGIFTAVQPGSG